MNKKIIVIEGYLASGKTTFAIRLSKALNIPYFAKDTFKMALCKSAPFNDMEGSSRFSGMTFDAIIYVVERLMETSCPIIIEGNFVPAGLKKVDEAGVIKSLIDQYGYQSLTFQFMGDTHSLYQRFVEREKSSERAQLLKMFYEPSYDEFEIGNHNLNAFDIGGEIVKIDTTDFEKVDFDSYIKIAQDFVKNTNPSK